MSCPKTITYGYSGQVWGSFINVRFLSKADVRWILCLTLLICLLPTQNGR